MNKTTIYLDAEEDITSVIDKVSVAKDKIVALVPPKKMAILQSAVNLKLLKKIAKDKKKNLVIISKDATLKPLAGAVGIHLADTLSSRPYIPETPETDSNKDISISEEDVVTGDNTPIGILDKTKTNDKQEDETPSTETKKKKKGDNKFLASIPNFGKFRLKLILAVIGVIGLGVAWFVGFVIMPKADIVITAQTSKTPVALDFVLDEALTVDDIEGKELRPVVETSKITLTATVEASGEENVGEKAKGTITVRNCESSSIETIVAGSRFIASGNYVFTTDAAVNVPPAVFSDGGATCTPGEASVAVTAAESGDSYNLAVNTFFTAVTNDNFTGIGSKMSGGTNLIKTVVKQADLDDAAKDLKKELHDDALAELEAQFALDVVPITATFTVEEGKPTSTPDVGAEAEQVIVNLVYTYTMQGVKLNSLSSLIDNALDEAIATTQLSVYENGLDDAEMSFEDGVVTLVTNGFTGPELDVAQLAEEVSGKSVSDIRSILKAKPGVNDVTVSLEPLWVFRSPNADKISIEIVVTEHALQ